MGEGNQLLLMAVTVSRMIQESELDVVFAGPLGMLLLVQIEGSCPAPLREVALSLLRRIREHARESDEFGVLYFQMQYQAIASLYECSGSVAACALCRQFIRQWGLHLPPFLEEPLGIVLNEALLD